MILVGHSMGGLVSRMLTVHSTDQLWRLISEQPIDKLQGNPDTIERIKNTFEFEPVPGISRVITIGTPHRGSAFANDSVKWLGEKFITLPKVVTSDYTKIVAQNQTVLTNNKPLLVATSLDSLTPSHPLFNALLAAQAGDGVVYHNIVGKLEKPSLMSRIAGSGDGDGVVSLESARVAYAVSELLVDEEHSVLHRHPETILEVKRVLYEHLESRPKPLLPVIPIASKPNSFILK
jgi:pimeloyl-ACP methyl ester carboxylesterase